MRLKQGFLNGNTLKIIALIAMTIDHIGAEFFPQIYILRVIGRISFPIFAYMIAEGCYYTKNKLKYFFSVFSLGMVCQVFYYFSENSYYQCVLITFSLSILVIFAIQWAKKNILSPYVWTLPLMCVAAVIFLSQVLPEFIQNTDYHIDYGFFGVMLPVIISLSDRGNIRFILVATGTIFLAISLTPIQWWGLLALIPLAFYNGQRGILRIKYLFYIYYPAHIFTIYAISTLIK